MGCGTSEDSKSEYNPGEPETQMLTLDMMFEMRLLA